MLIPKREDTFNFVKRYISDLESYYTEDEIIFRLYFCLLVDSNYYYEILDKNPKYAYHPFICESYENLNQNIPSNLERYYHLSEFHNLRAILNHYDDLDIDEESFLNISAIIDNYINMEEYEIEDKMIIMNIASVYDKLIVYDYIPYEVYEIITGVETLPTSYNYYLDGIDIVYFGQELIETSPLYLLFCEDNTVNDYKVLKRADLPLNYILDNNYMKNLNRNIFYENIIISGLHFQIKNDHPIKKSFYIKNFVCNNSNLMEHNYMINFFYNRISLENYVEYINDVKNINHLITSDDLIVFSEMYKKLHQLPMVVYDHTNSFNYEKQLINLFDKEMDEKDVSMFIHDIFLYYSNEMRVVGNNDINEYHISFKSVLRFFLFLKYYLAFQYLRIVALYLEEYNPRDYTFIHIDKISKEVTNLLYYVLSNDSKYKTSYGLQYILDMEGHSEQRKRVKEIIDIIEKDFYD